MPPTSFRTPIPPAPVERFDVAHPAVPQALDGLTILHISDLHVRRNLLTTDRYQRILRALADTPADVIVLTGDLMDEPGHEPAAMETMLALAGAWRARFGVFCVFGNHDTPEFGRDCQRRIPSMACIGGRVVNVSINGATLRLAGLDWPEDPLAVLLTDPSIPGSLGPSIPSLSLALAHHPTALVSAADLNIPILLAGHTHAGQIRLHKRFSPHTSSDLPVHLASGILRLRDTLCCISRGLGDGVVENLRFNCPRQMPLYTLRRGPIPGTRSDTITQAVAW